MDKEIAEKSDKIALADTMTNFLTRQASYDFDQFYSVVETVKRIREDKTSPLRHLVPRIEEGIRVEALKAFEGDLVDKIFHQKVWDQKENYRKGNIQLKEENVLMKDQLTSVSKEKEILQQIKVYVEEKPRTLKELKAVMISICEEEIERRVKERFDRQTAAAYGMADFALRTIKKKTGTS